MSRRNTDAITIHSILDWIEDNLESPLSLEKVSERSGYSKWHLQRMFKKETGHSLGQYIRSRKMTEIAQKLKESNEPILYLAERYGFESQQTLTRTFKNYFDVPPHKYRMKIKKKIQQNYIFNKIIIFFFIFFFFFFFILVILCIF
ncbi:MDR efflux pump AcrAB transcriptional activator MarA [Escherichia coli]|uniref:MDR efflux pump AcrAB transcriptional activator MarA n=1 Tax=Escherichia coli TaxID=562 RepID=UPI002887D715|nr:MDR efflux pump AcrAB transcriptional activator MarA [Escherichia coli]MDT0838032.1 MDR efflux pump AcrAB transcriptional activator MarA [Escherichia coli]